MRSAASTKSNELKRFFVNLPEYVSSFPSDVTVSDAFTAHHLKSVLRAKPGEAVVIVHAETAYEAVITDLQKNSVAFCVEAKLPAIEDNLPHVTLVVALIKEQRWDLLLQKATELGVRSLQPLLTERSVIRLDEKDFSKKLERWQSVLRSAAEQSEGLFIPSIETPLSVAAYLQQSPADLRLILQERGDTRKPMRDVLQEHTKQSIALAIGPEGGWTTGELDLFEHAGFTGVSFGQRILRAETAAMAAMAAVVYAHGD
jgi:16S rRNA (uracil1498-N3)-methyltransferase